MKELDAIAAALSQHKRPPQDTKLGGALLIHGQPPEYAAELAKAQREHPGALRSGLRPGDADPAIIKEYQDWTDGCLALFNSDMRELYDLVPDGTPLTVVADGPITPPPEPPSAKNGHILH